MNLNQFKKKRKKGLIWSNIVYIVIGLVVLAMVATAVYEPIIVPALKILGFNVSIGSDGGDIIYYQELDTILCSMTALQYGTNAIYEGAVTNQKIIDDSVIECYCKPDSRPCRIPVTPNIGECKGGWFGDTCVEVFEETVTFDFKRNKVSDIRAEKGNIRIRNFHIPQYDSEDAYFSLLPREFRDVAAGPAYLVYYQAFPKGETIWRNPKAQIGTKTLIYMAALNMVWGVWKLPGNVGKYMSLTTKNLLKAGFKTVFSTTTLKSVVNPLKWIQLGGRFFKSLSITNIKTFIKNVAELFRDLGTAMINKISVAKDTFINYPAKIRNKLLILFDKTLLEEVFDVIPDEDWLIRSIQKYSDKDELIFAFRSALLEKEAILVTEKKQMKLLLDSGLMSDDQLATRLARLAKRAGDIEPSFEAGYARQIKEVLESATDPNVYDGLVDGFLDDFVVFDNVVNLKKQLIDVAIPAVKLRPLELLDLYAYKNFVGTSFKVIRKNGVTSIVPDTEIIEGTFKKIEPILNTLDTKNPAKFNQYMNDKITKYSDFMFDPEKGFKMEFFVQQKITRQQYELLEDAFVEACEKSPRFANILTRLDNIGLLKDTPKALGQMGLAGMRFAGESGLALAKRIRIRHGIAAAFFLGYHIYFESQKIETPTTNNSLVFFTTLPIKEVFRELDIADNKIEFKVNPSINFMQINKIKDGTENKDTRFYLASPCKTDLVISTDKAKCQYVKNLNQYKRFVDSNGNVKRYLTNLQYDMTLGTDNHLMENEQEENILIPDENGNPELEAVLVELEEIKINYNDPININNPTLIDPMNPIKILQVWIKLTKIAEGSDSFEATEAREAIKEIMHSIFDWEELRPKYITHGIYHKEAEKYDFINYEKKKRADDFANNLAKRFPDLFYIPLMDYNQRLALCNHFVQGRGRLFKNDYLFQDFTYIRDDDYLKVPLYERLIKKDNVFSCNKVIYVKKGVLSGTDEKFTVSGYDYFKYLLHEYPELPSVSQSTRNEIIDRFFNRDRSFMGVKPLTWTEEQYELYLDYYDGSLNYIYDQYIEDIPVTIELSRTIDVGNYFDGDYADSGDYGNEDSVTDKGRFKAAFILGMVAIPKSVKGETFYYYGKKMPLILNMNEFEDSGIFDHIKQISGRMDESVELLPKVRTHILYDVFPGLSKTGHWARAMQFYKNAAFDLIFDWEGGYDHKLEGELEYYYNTYHKDDTYVDDVTDDTTSQLLMREKYLKDMYMKIIDMRFELAWDLFCITVDDEMIPGKDWSPKAVFYNKATKALFGKPRTESHACTVYRVLEMVKLKKLYYRLVEVERELEKRANLTESVVECPNFNLPTSWWKEGLLNFISGGTFKGNRMKFEIPKSVIITPLMDPEYKFNYCLDQQNVDADFKKNVIFVASIVGDMILEFAGAALAPYTAGFSLLASTFAQGALAAYLYYKEVDVDNKIAWPVGIFNDGYKNTYSDDINELEKYTRYDLDQSPKIAIT
ncbi:hypothetical protein ACFL1H_00195 [Nanoarchaeota archaeon]